MDYILKAMNEYTVVHETQTDQNILICDSYDRAKEYQRKLNFGAGFSGWTPNFILLSAKEKLGKSLMG